MKNLETTISHKVCGSCYEQLRLIISEKNTEKMDVMEEISDGVTELQNESEKLSLEQKDSSGSEYITTSQSKRKLDSMLEPFGLPPFKRKKMSDKAVVNAGVSIIQTMTNQVSEAFEVAENVKLPVLNLTEAINNQSSFEALILNLKSKYDDDTTKYDDKISILTVLPKEWNLQQINQYFKCTKCMLKESQKLRENKGKICKIILYF